MLMLTFARRTVESVVRLYMRARTLQELRRVSPRLLADVGVDTANLDAFVYRLYADAPAQNDPNRYDVPATPLATAS